MGPLNDRFHLLCRNAAALAVLIAAISPALAGKSKFNRRLSAGDAAPDWKELPGADDKRHSLADFEASRVLILFFTSSHCPVSKLYEERVKELCEYFPKEQAQVVAIFVDQGDEAFKKMKGLAEDRKLPFSCLHDPSRQIARSYGATVTPHFFVLDPDRKIAYMGAFDDQITREKVERLYLLDAVEALLAGKKPRVAETLQRGCEIQYEPTSSTEDP